MLWLVPAVPVHMVPMPSALNRGHVLGRWVLLLLTRVLFLPNDKNTWRFSGWGEDLLWKMAFLCAWQDFIQAYSCMEGRPSVQPPLECSSRHIYGKVSCRPPAACCEFYVTVLCSDHNCPCRNVARPCNFIFSFMVLSFILKSQFLVPIHNSIVSVSILIST